MYVMKFSFPVATLVAIFSSIYGPICKPGGEFS